MPHKSQRLVLQPVPATLQAHPPDSRVSNLHAMQDMARLSRWMAGKAVGLVLSGGGSRGLAHLGVLHALDDAGIPVDVIGGTSQGAFMAALYAQVCSLGGLEDAGLSLSWRCSHMLPGSCQEQSSWANSYARSAAPGGSVCDHCLPARRPCRCSLAASWCMPAPCRCCRAQQMRQCCSAMSSS